MLDLDDYEHTLCECGLPEEIADTDPHLQIRHRVCPVCSGLAVAARVQAHADDEQVRALGQKPAPEAPRPTDGRHVRVEPAAPPDQDDSST